MWLSAGISNENKNFYQCNKLFVNLMILFTACLPYLEKQKPATEFNVINESRIGNF